MSSPGPPSFDRIARPYRWLEYLTFGPALTHCRNHFVAALADRRNALVLGDGDGRFLARLMSINPQLHADAVDTSSTMLHLLARRARAVQATNRLRTHQADALTFTPTDPYDVIVTHFFLDCLTHDEIATLISRITPHRATNALWLVSDFRIPRGLLRLPALAVVRSLYLAFRLLAGLRITRLPDYASALQSAGFTRIAQHLSLAGLLTTELWAYPPAPSSE